MRDKCCLTCVKKCKEKIEPEYKYCNYWTDDVKCLTFEERLDLFKEALKEFIMNWVDVFGAEKILKVLNVLLKKESH